MRVCSNGGDTSTVQTKSESCDFNALSIVDYHSCRGNTRSIVWYNINIRERSRVKRSHLLAGFIKTMSKFFFLIYLCI